MASRKVSRKIARKPAAAKKSAKKVASRKSAKKAVRKTVKKATRKGARAGSAFMKPVAVSEQLAAIVGSKPMPRTEVTKKLWAYIKKNKLQDAKQRRVIVADAKLKPIFGVPKLDMFKMTAKVSKHLKPTGK